MLLTDNLEFLHTHHLSILLMNPELCELKCICDCYTTHHLSQFHQTQCLFHPGMKK